MERWYASDEVVMEMSDEYVDEEEVEKLEAGAARQAAQWMKGMVEVEKMWIEKMERQMAGEPEVRDYLEVWNGGN